MTIPPVPPAPRPSGDDEADDRTPPQSPGPQSSAPQSPYGVTAGDPSPAAPVPRAQPYAAPYGGALPPGPAVPPPHVAGPRPVGPGDVNPYAPQASGSAGTAPSRGMSIAALILGAGGLVFSWFLLGIPSILAIVFGHIGLRREPAGRGLAIAGLVLGYVSVGIFLLWLVFFLVSAVLGFAGW